MINRPRYSPEHLAVTTWLTCGDQVSEQFEEWALGLKPDLDGGECGADENGEPLPESAYLWVLRQNADARFLPGGMYQTFIFLDAGSGEFLATGSIVPDDRDIAAKYRIDGAGFYGFVNVRRDIRGRGLGRLVCEFMDQHVQMFIDRMRRPANFSLFTANPIAVRIYRSVGFDFVRSIHIDEFGADEDLYTKTYLPGGLARPLIVPGVFGR